MKNSLVACIPNISEGRNRACISAIEKAILSVPHVKILHVDMGFSVNRTVITFVGSGEQILEAAFRCIQEAKIWIDMSEHKGTHPRMGAVDVCPLVPLSGITMNEVMVLAEKLAIRTGSECQIPVFRYEKNALQSYRKKLSQIRLGEYEGWFQKIKNPLWKPDFGPDEVSSSAGVIAIGARNIMIAYNVNIKSTSLQLAKEIAMELRESGFSYINEAGIKINVPGICKGVRAIGWFIPEFNCVQVSMNLMELSATSLLDAYLSCKQLAEAKGTEVSGSEIVGMVPESEILSAGRYFLPANKEFSTKDELVSAAMKGLGLSDKVIFVPEEKIIEWRYNALDI